MTDPALERPNAVSARCSRWTETRIPARLATASGREPRWVLGAESTRPAPRIEAKTEHAAETDARNNFGKASVELGLYFGGSRLTDALDGGDLGGSWEPATARRARDRVFELTAGRFEGAALVAIGATGVA